MNAQNNIDEKIEEADNKKEEKIKDILMFLEFDATFKFYLNVIVSRTKEEYREGIINHIMKAVGNGSGLKVIANIMVMLDSRNVQEIQEKLSLFIMNNVVEDDARFLNDYFRLIKYCGINGDMIDKVYNDNILRDYNVKEIYLRK